MEGSDSGSDSPIYDIPPDLDNLEMLKHLPEGVRYKLSFHDLYTDHTLLAISRGSMQESYSLHGVSSGRFRKGVQPLAREVRPKTFVLPHPLPVT